MVYASLTISASPDTNCIRQKHNALSYALYWELDNLGCFREVVGGRRWQVATAHSTHMAGAAHTFVSRCHVLLEPSQMTIHESPASDLLGPPYALTSAFWDRGEAWLWLCSHLAVSTWLSLRIWFFFIESTCSQGASCKHSARVSACTTGKKHV